MTVWGITLKTNHRESHRLAESPTPYIDSALLGPGTRPGTLDRSDLGMQIADSAMLLTVGIVLVTCRPVRSEGEKKN